MQIRVLIIDKVSETFDTKKGSKTVGLLVCQDLPSTAAEFV
jgi:hypothetical protein